MPKTAAEEAQLSASLAQTKKNNEIAARAQAKTASRSAIGGGAINGRVVCGGRRRGR